MPAPPPTPGVGSTSFRDLPGHLAPLSSSPRGRLSSRRVAGALQVWSGRISEGRTDPGPRGPLLRPARMSPPRSPLLPSFVQPTDVWTSARRPWGRPGTWAAVLEGPSGLTGRPASCSGPVARGLRFHGVSAARRALVLLEQMETDASPPADHCVIHPESRTPGPGMCPLVTPAVAEMRSSKHGLSTLPAHGTFRHRASRPGDSRPGCQRGSLGRRARCPPRGPQAPFLLGPPEGWGWGGDCCL